MIRFLGHHVPFEMLCLWVLEVGVLSALICALMLADVPPSGAMTLSADVLNSAVVLAAGGWGPDLQMQRLMRRRGGGMPGASAVLECNPRHPLIRALAARADADGDVAEAAQTLLDLARVQDGEAPRDPAAFARRVTEALAGSA